MASLYAPVSSAQEMNNPSCVKVVVDARGYALMFSRAAIPWNAPDKAAGTLASMRIHANF